MATPIWRGGTIYPPGSVVIPTGPTAPPTPVFANPNFTSDAAGWTLSGGGSPSWSATGGFSDPGCVMVSATGELNDGIVTSGFYPVAEGQSLTFGCQSRMASGTAGTSCQAAIIWFDSGSVQIGLPSYGANRVRSSVGSGWVAVSVTASAPAGAAFAKFVSSMNVSASGLNVIYTDNFTISSTGGGPPAGLVYKAVQSGIGTSAAGEPVWPLTAGLTVVDGSVTWEAVIATRITYRAVPILKSGATEPTWPEVIGSTVPDNTIMWTAATQQVTQAPQSKVVTIASSKVYAADEDLVRYSATVNPLDWTAADDAGYLATGLNQYGSNRTAVLNTYRSNVVPFSASTFQNWQVDPDPANITLLDSMEGIGSTYQQAAHPVANELFYLSPLGVRTVGIAAGTANLSAGDAGAPIDPLVEGALRTVGVRPLAAYYPNQGQYWLMMRPPLPEYPSPTIEGDPPDGRVGVAWADYPYTVGGGTPPLVVTLEDGELPPGLGPLDTDGIIDGGIPTQYGTYTHTAQVTDANGLTDSVTNDIMILGFVLALGKFADSPQTLAGYGDDWSAAWAAGAGMLSSGHILGTDVNFICYQPSSPHRPVVSSDFGATWTEGAGDDQTVGGSTKIGAWNPNTSVVLLPQGSGTPPGTMGYLRSTDRGDNWSHIDVNIGANAATYIGSKWLSVVTSTAVIRSSVDNGTTWDAGATPAGISFVSYVAVGTSNTTARFGGSNLGGTAPAIVTTLTGTSFAVDTLPTVTGVGIKCLTSGLVDGVETWVAATDEGEILYKIGSGAWLLSADTMLCVPHSVVFDGERFYMIGGSQPAGDANYFIKSSPTGEEWTTQRTGALGVTDQMYGLAVMGLPV